METIFVLLPLALLIAAIAVGFFIWAARTGPARAASICSSSSLNFSCAVAARSTSRLNSR